MPWTWNLLRVLGNGIENPPWITFLTFYTLSYEYDTFPIFHLANLKEFVTVVIILNGNFSFIMLEIVISMSKPV